MFSYDNISSPSVVDDTTYDCKSCVLSGRKNTVKQYYVNLDATVDMCSVCQAAYLMEKEVAVNNQVQSAVSRKSMQKMTLLPLLLKNSDMKLSQEGVMQFLDDVYQNYMQNSIRHEQKWNQFLSLTSHLLPNQVDCSEYPEMENTKAGFMLEENQDSSAFYFDTCSQIKKEEVTDADIEAAITALTCENASAMNYEELSDIDSFLQISSSELDLSLPILSDETLFSPIVISDLKKFNDEAFKSFNENQNNGIKVNIDFAALQKKLCPIPEQVSNSSCLPKTTAKSIKDCSGKANNLLRRTRLLHTWNGKRSKVALLDKKQFCKILNNRESNTSISETPCFSTLFYNSCVSVETSSNMYSLESASFLNPYCSLQNTFDIYNSEISRSNSSNQTSKNNCFQSTNTYNLSSRIPNTVSNNTDDSYCNVKSVKMFKGFDFKIFNGKPSTPSNSSQKKKRKPKYLVEGDNILKMLKAQKSRQRLSVKET